MELHNRDHHHNDHPRHQEGRQGQRGGMASPPQRRQRHPHRHGRSARPDQPPDPRPPRGGVTGPVPVPPGGGASAAAAASASASWVGSAPPAPAAPPRAAAFLRPLLRRGRRGGAIVGAFVLLASLTTIFGPPAAAGLFGGYYAELSGRGSEGPGWSEAGAAAQPPLSPTSDAGAENGGTGRDAAVDSPPGGAAVRPPEARASEGRSRRRRATETGESEESDVGEAAPVVGTSAGAGAGGGDGDGGGDGRERGGGTAAAATAAGTAEPPNATTAAVAPRSSSSPSAKRGGSKIKLQCHTAPLAPLRPNDRLQYTVRMNTYRRNAALQVSVDYLATCEGVAQIQVVWCDADNDPPPSVSDHASGKVVVERHPINNLNERFNVLLEPPTLGVLSMDEDKLRPCEALDNAFFRWTNSPDRMVGFEPRAVRWEGPPARMEYNARPYKLRRHRGAYSMALTSFAFLHRDYLDMYSNDLRGMVHAFVHQAKNCEDIAMSFLVAACTGGKAPLLAERWANDYRAYTEPRGSDGISTQSGHSQIRNICTNVFSDYLGLQGGPSRGGRAARDGQVRLAEEDIYYSHNASDFRYNLMGVQDDRPEVLVRGGVQVHENVTEREALQATLLVVNEKTRAMLKKVFLPTVKIGKEVRRRARIEARNKG